MLATNPYVAVCLGVAVAHEAIVATKYTIEWMRVLRYKAQQRQTGHQVGVNHLQMTDAQKEHIAGIVTERVIAQMGNIKIDERTMSILMEPDE